MANETKDSKSIEEQLSSLESEKAKADEKVQELEKALAKARQISETVTLELVRSKEKAESTAEEESKPEVKSHAPKKEVKPEATKKTDTPIKTTKKATPTKQNGGEKVSSDKLKEFKASSKVRMKGKFPAKEGNELKKSSSEVFLYIVDDNELQLKMMQEKFKGTRSYKKTVGFKTGEECLKYFKTHKYKKTAIIIVIIDYYLENSDEEDVMNGIDLLTSLKEYDPGIEVIMLSSHEDVDLASSASHFGAASYIIKGADSFKKVINNIQWIVKEKDAIRKKVAGKQFFKSVLVVFAILIVSLLAVDTFVMKGKWGIATWALEVPEDVQPAPGTTDVENAVQPAEHADDATESQTE